MITKIIHNVDTGEIVEVELSEAELEQRKADELADAEKMAKRAQEFATKQSVIAKLNLSNEELAALLV